MKAYWAAELLMDALLLFLVASLTLRALEGSPTRPGAIKLLGVIVVTVVVLPFAVFEGGYFSPRWSESTGQLLNFGAGVMTFVLWTSLLLNKQRDRQLLTVAAGIGITVSCAALTIGVLHLTNQGNWLRDVAAWVYRVGQTASWVIWCRAFWPARKSPPPTAASPSH